LGNILATSVVFLASTRESPSLEEQREACAKPGDLIVEAGQVSFADLPRRLALQGRELMSGDRIKVFDLTCLPMNTTSLIRVMMKVLNKGITIELCGLGLSISPPSEGSEVFRMLEALDHHWRHVHGLKTHSGDSKPGRKARLGVKQLPQIRAMLAEGQTVSSIARELQVGRSTLFDFLKRHGAVAAVS
jgi:hypothetical protein